MASENDGFACEIIQLLRPYSLEELEEIHMLWSQEVAAKEARQEVLNFINWAIDAVMKEKKEGAVC